VGDCPFLGFFAHDSYFSFLSLGLGFVLASSACSDWRIGCFGSFMLLVGE